MENIKSWIWDLGSLIIKSLLTLIKSELKETIKANLVNQKQSLLGQQEIWQKLETKWFSMSIEDFNAGFVLLCSSLKLLHVKEQIS